MTTVASNTLGRRRWPSVGPAAALVPALVFACCVQAQPPEPSGAQDTVRGIVQRFTTAPKGEVDGLILEDGTWVHWPPHLENRFKGVAGKGERIRATGRYETGPAGDTKFEVISLSNRSAKAAPSTDDGHGRFGNADSGRVRGTVQRFTSAPKGRGRWARPQ
jgi:hypothetical protein